MNKKTKFSIILPVFHAERDIIKCVKSILNQTYKCFELVLVSDDLIDYKNILESKGIKDRRIIFTTTAKYKSGAAVARNVGLDSSTGDWITFCDSDDCFTPSRLEAIVKHTPLHRVIADITEFRRNEDSKLIGFNPPTSDRSRISSIQDYLASTVPVSFAFYRETILDLKFDKKIEFAEDTLYKALGIIENKAQYLQLDSVGYIANVRAKSLSIVEHRVVEKAYQDIADAITLKRVDGAHKIFSKRIDLDKSYRKAKSQGFNGQFIEYVLSRGNSRII